ncbi:LLM class flavin-dependent oxidoreductase [Candidatus Entotheonella palauensis]|uniref:LLM class flavin-dependent oxidoreductase n=1 Tax=Candidatus Entotheonella palauensis TaxID=93172 RepID=UPI002118D406|nr:LLM class flavin-dependent oxidoreductase [Candidatus Entotheonella palauensis]
MLLNAFHMNCVSHIQHGMWVRDDTRQLEYTQLEPWVELAQILEKGRFDALFLADVIGLYDTYRGGPETSLLEGMQVPVNDPALLISAMAHVTENLGFAFTSSVLQTHPFTFARQISTLDHLTRGRVAWNVVTSYLSNAAASLGLGGLPTHDERYDRADEYLDVTYKLWEGSWEDDAVLRDTKRRMYADPAKVHPINHVGKHYEVAGPHLCEPSPQRTPLLFQAGSSTRGREFAAKHAECVFIVTSRASLSGTASIVKDIRAQAVRQGRRPEDVRFFQGLTPVVGGTEAEAKAKEAAYIEQANFEGSLAHMSGSIGVDLGTINLDQPLATFDFQSVRGSVKGLIESSPDKSATFRDLIRSRMLRQFLTGTPEQVADELQAWFEAGVDGFNLVYTVTPGTFVDFIDGVVPVLQARGLVQREYAPGPLRQKIFGDARLPKRHPAAAYRRG